MIVKTQLTISKLSQYVYREAEVLYRLRIYELGFEESAILLLPSLLQSETSSPSMLKWSIFKSDLYIEISNYQLLCITRINNIGGFIWESWKERGMISQGRGGGCVYDKKRGNFNFTPYYSFSLIEKKLDSIFCLHTFPSYLIEILHYPQSQPYLLSQGNHKSTQFY